MSFPPPTDPGSSPGCAPQLGYALGATGLLLAISEALGACKAIEANSIVHLGYLFARRLGLNFAKPAPAGGGAPRGTAVSDVGVVFSSLAEALVDREDEEHGDRAHAHAHAHAPNTVDTFRWDPPLLLHPAVTNRISNPIWEPNAPTHPLVSSSASS